MFVEEKKLVLDVVFEYLLIKFLDIELKNFYVGVVSI